MKLLSERLTMIKEVGSLYPSIEKDDKRVTQIWSISHFTFSEMGALNTKNKIVYEERGRENFTTGSFKIPNKGNALEYIEPPFLDPFLLPLPLTPSSYPPPSPTSYPPPSPSRQRSHGFWSNTIGKGRNPQCFHETFPDEALQKGDQITEAFRPTLLVVRLAY